LPIDTTIKLVRQVEATHKNLGLPLLFLKLIDLADMGCFVVGPRGVGKTTLLRSLINLMHRDVMEITRLTPAGLAHVASEMSNRQLTIVNPDFSSFYTDYLKDAGINLISFLLTEHGVPRSWTAKYCYDVTNCYISFISATQPSALKRINKLPQWESMYKDRFIRFFMLYPFGSPTYRTDLPSVPEIEFSAYSCEEVAITKTIKETDGYLRLKEIIQRQTSEGRAGMYTDRLLKAHAYLNGRDIVLEEDVEVLNLLAPYLILDFMLSKRDSPSSPLLFDADAYLVFFYLVEKGEATRSELRDYFMLQKEKKGSVSALTRALEPLLAGNLAEGVYGSPTYRVSKRFRERYLNPLREWYDSAVMRR